MARHASWELEHGAELDGDFPHLLVENLEGPTLGALIRREAPLPLHQTLPLVTGRRSAVFTTSVGRTASPLSRGGRKDR